MKVRAKGDVCITITETESGAINVQDEGIDLGTVNVLNFVGGNVTVEKTGDTATITINGGGGSSFTIIDYTDFETDGLPASPTTNGIYRLVFTDPDFQQTIDDVQYYNNKIIYWTGDHWISWSADYGAST